MPRSRFDELRAFIEQGEADRRCEAVARALRIPECRGAAAWTMRRPSLRTGCHDGLHGQLAEHAACFLIDSGRGGGYVELYCRPDVAHLCVAESERVVVHVMRHEKHVLAAVFPDMGAARAALTELAAAVIYIGGGDAAAASYLRAQQEALQLIGERGGKPEENGGC